MFAPNSYTLLNETDGQAVAINGTAVRFKDYEGDNVSAQEQTYLAVFELVAAGGSSPTTDAVVQTSWDGSTWHTVATMTQLSGAGTSLEVKPITYIGPYVRTVVTPGGTSNPTVTGKVLLTSSGLLQAVG